MSSKPIAASLALLAAAACQDSSNHITEPPQPSNLVISSSDPADGDAVLTGSGTWSGSRLTSSTVNLIGGSDSDTGPVGHWVYVSWAGSNGELREVRHDWGPYWDGPDV